MNNLFGLKLKEIPKLHITPPENVPQSEEEVVEYLKCNAHVTLALHTLLHHSFDTTRGNVSLWFCRLPNGDPIAITHICLLVKVVRQVYPNIQMRSEDFQHAFDDIVYSFSDPIRMGNALLNVTGTEPMNSITRGNGLLCFPAQFLKDALSFLSKSLHDIVNQLNHKKKIFSETYNVLENEDLQSENDEVKKNERKVSITKILSDNTTKVSIASVSLSWVAPNLCQHQYHTLTPAFGIPWSQKHLEVLQRCMKFFNPESSEQKCHYETFFIPTFLAPMFDDGIAVMQNHNLVDDSDLCPNITQQRRGHLDLRKRNQMMGERNIKGLPHRGRVSDTTRNRVNSLGKEIQQVIKKTRQERKALAKLRHENSFEKPIRKPRTKDRDVVRNIMTENVPEVIHIHPEIICEKTNITDEYRKQLESLI